MIKCAKNNINYNTGRKPDCFGVYRSPQSNAENCCNDCNFDNGCAKAALEDGTGKRKP